MPEAWRVRRHQQQEFVRELAHEVREWAERCGDYHEGLLRFGIALLWDLRERVTGQMAPTGGHPVLENDLLREIAERIRAFARVKSERAYLLMSLFGELEVGMFTVFTSLYYRDEALKPQEVFGAPSPTAEVGLGKQ